MPDTSYFFITGTSRSGTTLLQAMLSRGRGVFVPPETHFMPLVWKHRRRLGQVSTDAGWTAAQQAIIQRSPIAGIVIDPGRFEELASKGPRQYGTLLSAWLRAAAEAQTPQGQECPSIFGEKSPAHTMYMPELLAMLPGTQVVHIVRDPRDVAVSQRDAWNTPIMSSAVRWMLDQRQQQDIELLASSDRFVTVRYEDLVVEPEAQLRRVCDVLSITFTPDMLKPHQRSQSGFADREEHKHRTLESVTTSRVGRYRRELSPMELAAIERVCGGHMERLGYELEGSPAWRSSLAVCVLSIPMAWRKARLKAPAKRIARRVSKGRSARTLTASNATGTE